ncbi:hypothetical protein J3F83DRAFT_731504 [Trichoderma novae-zelandiae]
MLVCRVYGILCITPLVGGWMGWDGMDGRFSFSFLFFQTKMIRTMRGCIRFWSYRRRCKYRESKARDRERECVKRAVQR